MRAATMEAKGTPKAPMRNGGTNTLNFGKRSKASPKTTPTVDASQSSGQVVDASQPKAVTAVQPAGRWSATNTFADVVKNAKSVPAGQHVSSNSRVFTNTKLSHDERSGKAHKAKASVRVHEDQESVSSTISDSHSAASTASTGSKESLSSNTTTESRNGPMILIGQGAYRSPTITDSETASTDESLSCEGENSSGDHSSDSTSWAEMASEDEEWSEFDEEVVQQYYQTLAEDSYQLNKVDVLNEKLHDFIQDPEAVKKHHFKTCKMTDKVMKVQTVVTSVASDGNEAQLLKINAEDGYKMYAKFQEYLLTGEPCECYETADPVVLYMLANWLPRAKIVSERAFTMNVPIIPKQTIPESLYNLAIFIAHGGKPAYLRQGFVGFDYTPWLNEIHYYGGSLSYDDSLQNPCKAMEQVSKKKGFQQVERSSIYEAICKQRRCTNQECDLSCMPSDPEDIIPWLLEIEHEMVEHPILVLHENTFWGYNNGHGKNILGVMLSQLSYEQPECVVCTEKCEPKQHAVSGRTFKTPRKLVCGPYKGITALHTNYPRGPLTHEIAVKGGQVTDAVQSALRPDKLNVTYKGKYQSLKSALQKATKKKYANITSEDIYQDDLIYTLLDTAADAIWESGIVGIPTFGEENEELEGEGNVYGIVLAQYLPGPIEHANITLRHVNKYKAVGKHLNRLPEKDLLHYGKVYDTTITEPVPEVQTSKAAYSSSTLPNLVIKVGDKREVKEVVEVESVTSGSTRTSSSQGDEFSHNILVAPKINKSDKRYPEGVVFFRGHRSPLSNMATDDANFCVERAYQTAKANMFGYKMPNTKDPYKCKKAGKLTNKQQREWVKHSVDVMTKLVHKKFENPLMAKYLLDTGNATLIEDTSDIFWGNARGNGMNQLGVILEEVRSKIRHAKESAESCGSHDNSEHREKRPAEALSTVSKNEVMTALNKMSKKAQKKIDELTERAMVEVTHQQCDALIDEMLDQYVSQQQPNVLDAPKLDWGAQADEQDALAAQTITSVTALPEVSDAELAEMDDYLQSILSGGVTFGVTQETAEYSAQYVVSARIIKPEAAQLTEESDEEPEIIGSYLLDAECDGPAEFWNTQEYSLLREEEPEADDVQLAEKQAAEKAAQEQAEAKRLAQREADRRALEEALATKAMEKTKEAEHKHKLDQIQLKKAAQDAERKEIERLALEAAIATKKRKQELASEFKAIDTQALHNMCLIAPRTIKTKSEKYSDLMELPVFCTQKGYYPNTNGKKQNAKLVQHIADDMFTAVDMTPKNGHARCKTEEELYEDFITQLRTSKQEVDEEQDYRDFLKATNPSKLTSFYEEEAKQVIEQLPLDEQTQAQVQLKITTPLTTEACDKYEQMLKGWTDKAKQCHKFAKEDKPDVASQLDEVQPEQQEQSESSEVVSVTPKVESVQDETDGEITTSTPVEEVPSKEETQHESTDVTPDDESSQEEETADVVPEEETEEVSQEPEDVTSEDETSQEEDTDDVIPEEIPVTQEDVTQEVITTSDDDEDSEEEDQELNPEEEDTLSTTDNDPKVLGIGESLAHLYTTGTLPISMPEISAILTDKVKSVAENVRTSSWDDVRQTAKNIKEKTVDAFVGTYHTIPKVASAAYEEFQYCKWKYGQGNLPQHMFRKVTTGVKHLYEILPHAKLMSIEKYFIFWLPMILMIYSTMLWRAGKTMSVTPDSTWYYKLTHYNYQHFYVNFFTGFATLAMVPFMDITRIHTLYIWLLAIGCWMTAAGTSAFIVPMIGFTLHPFLLILALVCNMTSKLHLVQLIGVLAFRMLGYFNVVGICKTPYYATAITAALYLFLYDINSAYAEAGYVMVSIVFINMYAAYRIYNSSDFCVECRCMHKGTCELPEQLTSLWFLAPRNAIPRVYITTKEQTSENIRVQYIKKSHKYDHPVLNEYHLSWTRINENTILRPIPEPVDLEERNECVYSKIGATLVEELDQTATGLNVGGIDTNRRYCDYSLDTEHEVVHQYALKHGLSIQYTKSGTSTKLEKEPDYVLHMIAIICLSFVLPIDPMLALVLATMVFTLILFHAAFNGELSTDAILITHGVVSIKNKGITGIIFNMVILAERVLGYNILVKFVPIVLAVQFLGKKAVVWITIFAVASLFDYSVVLASIIIIATLVTRKWNYLPFAIGAASYGWLAHDYTPVAIFSLAVNNGISPYQVFLYVYSIVFRAEYCMTSVNTIIVSICIAAVYRKWLIVVALSIAGWAKFYNLILAPTSETVIIGYSIYQNVSYKWYIYSTFIGGVMIIVPIVVVFVSSQLHAKLATLNRTHVIQLCLAILGSFTMWNDLYMKVKLASTLTAAMNMFIPDVSDMQTEEKKSTKHQHRVSLAIIVLLLAGGVVYNLAEDPDITPYKMVNTYKHNAQIINEIMQANVLKFGRGNYTLTDVEVPDEYKLASVFEQYDTSVHCQDETSCTITENSPGVSCTYEVVLSNNYYYTKEWSCLLKPDHQTVKRKPFSSHNIMPHAPWLCKAMPGDIVDHGHLVARMLGGVAAYYNCMPQTHSDNQLMVDGEILAKAKLDNTEIQYKGIVRPYSGRYVVIGDESVYSRCVQGKMTRIYATTPEQVIDIFINAQTPTFIVVSDELLRHPKISKVYMLAAKECTASPLVTVDGIVSTDIIQRTPAYTHSESKLTAELSLYNTKSASELNEVQCVDMYNEVVEIVFDTVSSGYHLPDIHQTQLKNVICKIITSASKSQLSTIIVDPQTQIYMELLVSAAVTVNRIWGKQLVQFARNNVHNFVHILPQFTIVPCVTADYKPVAALPVLVSEDGYCNTPDGITLAHAVANAHNKPVYLKADHCTVVTGEVYIVNYGPCATLDYNKVSAQDTGVTFMTHTPGYNQFQNGAFDAFLGIDSYPLGMMQKHECAKKGLPVKFYNNGHVQLTCSMAFLYYKPEGIATDYQKLWDTHVVVPNITIPYTLVEDKISVNYHPIIAYLPFWPKNVRTVQDKCLHDYLATNSLPIPDHLQVIDTSIYEHGLCQLLSFTLPSIPRSAEQTYSGYTKSSGDIYDIPSAIEYGITHGVMHAQCGKSFLDSPYVRNFLHIPVACITNTAKADQAILEMYGYPTGKVTQNLIHNTLRYVAHTYTHSEEDVTPTLGCKLLFAYNSVDDDFCSTDRYVYGPAASSLIRAGKMYGRKHIYLPLPGYATYVTHAKPTVGIKVIDDIVLTSKTTVKIDTYYYVTSVRAFNMLPYPRAHICVETFSGVKTCVNYLAKPVIIMGLRITPTQEKIFINMGTHDEEVVYTSLAYDISRVVYSIAKLIALNAYDILLTISRFNMAYFTSAVTVAALVIAVIHHMFPFPTALLVYTNPLPLIVYYYPEISVLCYIYDAMLCMYGFYNLMWSINGQDAAAVIRRAGILTIYAHYIFGTQTTLGYAFSVIAVAFIAYNLYIYKTLKPWHLSKTYTKDEVAKLHRKYIDDHTMGGTKTGADMLNDLYLKGKLDKLKFKFLMALANAYKYDVELDYTPADLVQMRGGDFSLTVILSKIQYMARKLFWIQGKPIKIDTESATINSPIIQTPSWADQVQKYIIRLSAFITIKSTKGQVYVRHSYASASEESAEAAFRAQHPHYNKWGDVFVIPDTSDEGLVPHQIHTVTQVYMYSIQYNTWRTGYMSPDGTHSLSTTPGDSGSPIFAYDGKPKWVGIHVRGNILFYNGALTYNGKEWQESKANPEFAGGCVSDNFVTPIDFTLAARIILHTYNNFGFSSAESCTRWNVIGVTDPSVFTKPVQQRLSAILMKISPGAIRNTLNIRFESSALCEELKPLTHYAKVDNHSAFNSLMYNGSMNGLINIVESPFYFKWPLIAIQQVIAYAFIYICTIAYSIYFQTDIPFEISNVCMISTNYPAILSILNIFFVAHVPYQHIIQPGLMFAYMLVKFQRTQAKLRLDRKTSLKYAFDSLVLYASWYVLYVAQNLINLESMIVIGGFLLTYTLVSLAISSKYTTSFNPCESVVMEEHATSVRTLAMQLQSALTAARNSQYNAELAEIIANCMNYSIEQLRYSLQRIMDIYHETTNSTEGFVMNPTDMYLASLNLKGEDAITQICEYYQDNDLTEIVGLLQQEMKRLEDIKPGLDTKSDRAAVNKLINVYLSVSSKVRKAENMKSSAAKEEQVKFNKLAKVINLKLDHAIRDNLKTQAAKQACIRFLEEFPSLKGMMKSNQTLPDISTFDQILAEIREQYACEKSKARIVHTDGLTWDDDYIITSPLYNGYKIYAQVVEGHLIKCSADMRNRSILIGTNIEPMYICPCGGNVTLDTLHIHQQCVTPILRCGFNNISKLATLKHTVDCVTCRICPYSGKQHPAGTHCMICHENNNIVMSSCEHYSNSRTSTTARMIKLNLDGENVLAQRGTIVVSDQPRKTLDGQDFICYAVTENEETRRYYVNPDYPMVDYKILDNPTESSAVNFLFREGYYIYGGMRVAAREPQPNAQEFIVNGQPVYVLPTPFVNMAYRVSSYAKAHHQPIYINKPPVLKSGSGKAVREGLVVPAIATELVTKLTNPALNMTQLDIGEGKYLFAECDESLALEIAKSHYPEPVEYLSTESLVKPVTINPRKKYQSQKGDKRVFL